MNSEVAWVLVSSGTQVQPLIMLDPEYLPDYLSVSYDHEITSWGVNSDGSMPENLVDDGG